MALKLKQWIESEKITNESGPILLFGKRVDEDILFLRKEGLNAFGYNFSGEAHLEEAKEFILNPDPEDYYAWVVSSDLSLALLDKDALEDTLKKFNHLAKEGILLVVPLAEGEVFINPSLQTSQAPWKTKLSFDGWKSILEAHCDSMVVSVEPTDNVGVAAITISYKED